MGIAFFQRARRVAADKTILGMVEPVAEPVEPVKVAVEAVTKSESVPAPSHQQNNHSRHHRR